MLESIFTRAYDRDGVHVVFSRITRAVTFKRTMYGAALRELHPIADHVSPYTDALRKEQEAGSDVYDKWSTVPDYRDNPTFRKELNDSRDPKIPPSERNKYESAAEINRVIDEVISIISMVTVWEGLPVELPRPTDKEGLQALLDWYMSADDATLELWGDWADLCNALVRSFTPVQERPLATLTEAEKTDPLSVAAALVSQDG